MHDDKQLSQTGIRHHRDSSYSVTLSLSTHWGCFKYSFWLQHWINSNSCATATDNSDGAVE